MGRSVGEDDADAGAAGGWFAEFDFQRKMILVERIENYCQSKGEGLIADFEVVNSGAESSDCHLQDVGTGWEFFAISPWHRSEAREEAVARVAIKGESDIVRGDGVAELVDDVYMKSGACVFRSEGDYVLGE